MKKKIIPLFFLLLVTPRAYAQIITTVAGGDTLGLGDGGPAIDAELTHPNGIAVDAYGNFYIGDRDHDRVRKVNTSGIITTIAGIGGPFGFSGDGGPATDATLNAPYGVAVDDSGNVYFADEANFRIRKINKVGIITTIAGNGDSVYNGDNIPATAAGINYPGGVAVDGNGNIYITDDNNRIREVNKSGIITTIAGTGIGGFSGDNGPATVALIFRPYGIAIDQNGNLYFSDQANIRIRKIDNYGIITTIAGNGSGGYNGDNIPGTAAELSYVTGVSVDINGNIYIGDSHNNRVRKVENSGIITTIAGTGVNGYNGDGLLATNAELNSPAGVVVTTKGDIYISDFANNRIRFIQNTVSVGIINSLGQNINIYPNPSNGDFAIKINANINEIVPLTITNIYGKTLNCYDVYTNQAI